MHDAFLVRRSQRLGQRAGNLDDAFDGQAIRRDQLIQRLSLDQFHGEKVDAAGFFHRIQRYNIRMVECGDHAGFALEPGQAFGIAGNIRRQDLKRHVAPQLHIGGAIHLTHPARANRGVDPVMGERAVNQFEPPARHQVKVWPCLRIAEADSTPRAIAGFFPNADAGEQFHWPVRSRHTCGF